MRQIAIITGTRADFGHLLPVIKALQARPTKFEIAVIATGSHVVQGHGNTQTTIEAAGVTIHETIDILMTSNSKRGIAKSIGLATIAFAESFERLSPDAIIVLGDRYEILAASQAALVMTIPIFHIHGGEITAGAFDDSIRHSITKMASMHFVAAEPYRQRVIQLGEDPNTVFKVGAPGLDHLNTLEWMSKAELAKSLCMKLGPRIFVMTYHPVTRDPDAGVAELEPILQALNQFTDATIIMTHANADNSGDRITARLAQFASDRPEKRALVASLGQLRYLSLLRVADLVIGNSSSGLIEAPSLRKPTINIGDRQAGRLRAKSVLDTPARESAIVEAINTALSSEMNSILEDMAPLYGEGGAGEAIASILEGPWPGLQKSFVDLPPVKETI